MKKTVDYYMSLPYQVELERVDVFGRPEIRASNKRVARMWSKGRRGRPCGEALAAIGREPADRTSGSSVGSSVRGSRSLKAKINASFCP